MPPASYLWVHPEARISDDQAAEFCGWTEQESRQLGDQIMHRTLHQPKVSVAALTRAAAPARDR